MVSPSSAAAASITAAAVIAPEVSKIADAAARDNHNDSSSSIEAEAEQNVSNQTVIYATNDTDVADSINVKSQDEVKASNYLRTLSLIDTSPFPGQRSVQ